MIDSGDFSNRLEKPLRPDPVALEEMMEEVEENPGERDRAIALVCALGSAGYFKAVERFMGVFDKIEEASGME